MSNFIEKMYYLMPLLLIACIVVYPKNLDSVHFDRVTKCQCLGIENVDAKTKLYTNNIEESPINSSLCYGVPY